MFNPVVPYRYLRPIVYLFMADIVNPDLFVFVGPGFVSTSSVFMLVRMTVFPKKGKSEGGRFQHNLHDSLPKPL